MEKRLPLFLVLSMAVLFLWTVLFPPPERPEETRSPDETAEVTGAPTSPRADEVPTPEPVATPALGEVVVDEQERSSGPLQFGTPGETGSFQAIFSNRGARLVELRLGQYAETEGLSEAERLVPDNWVPLLVPVEMPDGSTSGSMLLRTSPSSRDLERGASLADALWRMQVLQDGSRPRGIEFQLAPGSGVRFVKRYLFDGETNGFRVELELHNEAAGPSSTRQFVLTPVGSMPSETENNRFYIEPKAVAAGPRGSEDQSLDAEARSRGAVRTPAGPLSVAAPLEFAGVHNKYFAVTLREPAVQPDGKLTMIGASYAHVYDAAWAAEHPDEAREAWRHVDVDVQLELRLPDPGSSVTYAYEVYAGPKDREQFLAADPAHDLVLATDIGWMSGIGSMLVGILGQIDRVTGNWGVAIILLTLAIRVLLFPLNRRFQTSMARHQKKMKRVQPKLDAIKEKYKNDSQKLRQEQGRIMQEEGAFPPLGGCLPMFLQIPIFIGLYGALRSSFDLRHAPFVGWITDLSQPDRLLELDLDVFLFEVEYLNLLPILMVVLWILQQRGMPTPADEQAARMQKMMTFMPIVMGFFLYNYAAGLSVYMCTQSALGIFEQQFIRKKWPIDDTEVEKKKKAGCGPFSGMMEQIAEKQKEQMKRIERQQGSNRGKGKGGKGGKRRR